MIVPQFWAESRQQDEVKGRKITVRRFGWSDTDQAEAQANAHVRAKEALQRLISGEKLPFRDPKIPYNGAVGVPIREEILSRHGETIITRNSYGAQCLNTPDLFFADIDFQTEPSLCLTLAIFGLIVLCAVATAWVYSNILTWAIRVPYLFPAFLLIAFLTAKFLNRFVQKVSGGAERVARNRIARFLAGHSGWNLRLYRTPAGMRVMATHQIFHPSEPDVAECFRALGTDPIYAKMCLNQQCFRARVSAKPWRIGISAHLRPRPGVWPVAPERMHLRTAWVAEYEKAAKSFAACTYLESIGSGFIHPKIKPVQELHDQLCSATSHLPIA